MGLETDALTLGGRYSVFDELLSYTGESDGWIGDSLREGERCIFLSFVLLTVGRKCSN